MLLENITQQQIQEFRQAFALFDKDGDGLINNKELKTVLRSLGHNPTKQQLDTFITLIDEDRSGAINFRQFLLLISQRFNQKTLFDQIMESFKVFDKDNDNYLSRIEIKKYYQVKDIQISTKLMKHQKLDPQGEGLIQISEYINFMLKVGGVTLQFNNYNYIYLQNLLVLILFLLMTFQHI